MEKRVSEKPVSTAPRLNYAAAGGRAALMAVVLVMLTLLPGLIRTGRLPHFAVARGAHLHAPTLGLLAEASMAIKIHLITLGIAALMALILISGVKGTRLHRALGFVFAGAMLTTGIVTLTIPPPPGPNLLGFGPLHLFSLTALIGVPVSLWAARNHKAMLHARLMVGLTFGGLGIAGLGAFTPGRLVWRLFFG